MDRQKIEEYWQEYLAAFPHQGLPNEPDRADRFGDPSSLADELGNLVLQGIKTATCSALWEWEAEGSELPQVGLKTVVLDGQGNPLCVIETTEVTLRPFQAVDAEFAEAEGEGDRSLDSWRKEHWQYFSRGLPTIGQQPKPEMVLVCERFQVVYR